MMCNMSFKICVHGISAQRASDGLLYELYLSNAILNMARAIAQLLLATTITHN
jgi:hypothetical protein